MHLRSVFSKETDALVSPAFTVLFLIFCMLTAYKCSRYGMQMCKLLSAGAVIYAQTDA